MSRKTGKSKRGKGKNKGGPPVEPSVETLETGSTPPLYNLRDTPARLNSRHNRGDVPAPPGGAPNSDGNSGGPPGEGKFPPVTQHDIPLPPSGGGGHVPAPNGPVTHSPNAPSSSSFSSPRGNHPDRDGPGGDEKDRKHSRLQSHGPGGNDPVPGSVLERLVLAIEDGRIGRRASGMDELQIKMLANYQPFDPAQDDMRSWMAGFKRLVPDDASDEQVFKALECRLPRQYADLLRQTRAESEIFHFGWKEAVRLFLNRVAGEQNRLLRLRRLKTLTQKDGEPIRQFAIRVRDELQKVRGRDPLEQEWKDEVMVGALDATAMELDRVANQMPGGRSFWEVIRAVEFWERQHAALLNQGDPSSAIRRSSAKGATVLFGEPKIASREPAVVCTWCSQRGHLESTCQREPRCARCFGGHPERNHDAVVMARRNDFAVGTPDRRVIADAGASHPGGRDFRGARHHAPRDSRDPDLSRPPPPPPRALARAAQDAAERERKRKEHPVGGGGHRKRKPEKDKERKCFSCGQEGHMKRHCPSLSERKEKKGRTEVQAHVAVVPQSPASVPADRDGGSPKADSELARRLENLERWREQSEGLHSQKSQGDCLSTDIERAARMVLSNLKGAAFDPFDRRLA